MNSSFGQTLLDLFRILDGKTLSYGYSNRFMEEKLRRFQSDFYQALIEYINNQDGESKKFLELCVNNLANILADNLDFYSGKIN